MMGKVIITSPLAMKTLTEERTAIRWARQWVETTPAHIRHPIVLEAIDHFQRLHQEPELGKVCRRIWKRHAAITKTKEEG